jgi:hypothetical protein
MTKHAEQLYTDVISAAKVVLVVRYLDTVRLFNGGLELLCPLAGGSIFAIPPLASPGLQCCTLHNGLQ